MRYLNGPTGDLVDTVLARESAGGTIAWYLPDRLGTVRDLINNSGAIIDHIDFSAFGTVLDQSDASEGDRMMGFAGMELDSVTGLNLAVNRVQNPGTGRWTSQDPLGFGAGDSDLYRYVGNMPTLATDPSGLYRMWIKDFEGGIWTLQQIFDVIAMSDKIASRLPGIIEQVEAVLFGLTPCQQQAIGGKLNDLWSMLRSLRSKLKSGTQIMRFEHSPFWFGRDRSMTHTAGGIWGPPKISFNDSRPWAGDLQLFFHELSHDVGTKDNPNGSNPQLDAALWQELILFPFTKTDIYKELMKQAAAACGLYG
jgi:RHS repeat-associated protein